MSCELWVVGFKLQVVSFKLQVVSCRQAIYTKRHAEFISAPHRTSGMQGVHIADGVQ